MKVEFEANYKDFSEITYLAWKKSPASIRLYPYLYFYILSAAISSIPIYVFIGNLWLSLITFTLILLVNFYFFRLPSRRYFENEAYKCLGNHKLFDVEIEFTETGIKTKQLNDEYLYGWQNIVEFEETTERICFFTKNQTGVAIPKRAFSSITMQAAFVAFAKARISTDLSKSEI